MDSYVRLALALEQPLSELMTWEPEAIATALIWLDERNEAAREANRKRR